MRHQAFPLVGMGLWAALVSLPLFAAAAPDGKQASRLWPEGLSWAKDASQFFVAPAGKPDAQGTRESPWDLASTLAGKQALSPGSVIWVGGGTYGGTLACVLQGTKAQPIIVRCSPGERATLQAPVQVAGDYIWLWGLEIAGTTNCAVNLASGHGTRLINLVIHDNARELKPGEVKSNTGQGIGGWDVGNDHEYYGNIIYRNSTTDQGHGIYSQNTAQHTVKKYIDNIVFENAGCGFHLYGGVPVLSGFYLEGNIAFATSLHPKYPRRGQINLLVGGKKPLSNVVLKDNCTYHPQAESKRGVDIGYTGGPNTNILVEGNYFTGGNNAMEIKNAASAIVRSNTFWAPTGMVLLTTALPKKQAAPVKSSEMPSLDGSPDVPPKIVAAEPPLLKAKDAAVTPGDAAPAQPAIIFEGNTYIDNGRFNLEQFRRQINSGQTDKVVAGQDGRPAGLHVFKRVNRYEPQRVHLAVYNWDHQEVVEIDLKGILKEGDAFRVVNVLDYYGPPVLEGKAKGAQIELPMKGHRYEPEFGAYVLFREATKTDIVK